jgi:hypothetical protein
LYVFHGVFGVEYKLRVLLDEVVVYAFGVVGGYDYDVGVF